MKADMNNADKPAFPESVAGLTKREYFAGLAMQAISSRGLFSEKDVAKMATDQADALLKKLNQQ